MFDEMPDQFYQFLAATSRATTTTTTTTTTPPSTSASSQPHSFSLHHPNFQPQHPSFDASYFLHHPQTPPLHLKQNEAKQTTLPPSSALPEPPVAVPPWSNDEVLALLNIRSATDNPWFPLQLTWENVSRKLAEVGFKRSAEDCKHKFEEETRSFNNIVSHNCSNNKNNNTNTNTTVISQNYRLFGELEELYSNTTNNGHHSKMNNDHNEEQDLHDTHDQPNNNDLCQDAKDNDENNEGERVGHEILGGNGETGVRDEDGIDDDDSERVEESSKEGRKRKRKKKFEFLKGFCEKIVKKLMARQEEFHCKILEDMVKRDEDKNSREETWRKQEVDRITKELEVRAHEKARVGDREAVLVGFLKKLSSSSSHSLMNRNNAIVKVPNTTSLLSTSSILSQDSVSATTTTHDHQYSKSNLVTLQKCNLPTSTSKVNVTPQSLNSLEDHHLTLPMSLSSLSKNPNPITSIENDLSTRLTSVSTTTTTTTHERFPSNYTSTNAAASADQVTDFIKSSGNHIDSNLENVNKDDIGRRWPRDEVLALINIRCSLFNNNDKESISKGPLWERISQRMDELGYKRSSKRCKEKWENINKYFRKTKDLNKKRSVDSRTCPYFHQLSHLYNHGEGAPLHGQSDSPETQSMPLSGAQGGSSISNGATTASAVHAYGTEDIVWSKSQPGSVLNFKM